MKEKEETKVEIKSIISEEERSGLEEMVDVLYDAIDLAKEEITRLEQTAEKFDKNKEEIKKLYEKFENFKNVSVDARKNKLKEKMKKYEEWKKQNE